jgi:hypothetical protein
MSTAIQLPLVMSLNDPFLPHHHHHHHQQQQQQQQQQQHNIHHAHSFSQPTFFDRRNDLVDDLALQDVPLFHDAHSHSPIDSNTQEQHDLDPYPLAAISPPDLNFAHFNARPSISRQLNEVSH